MIKNEKLLISYPKSKAKFACSIDNEGWQKILLETSENSYVVDRPGEYEYSSVHFSAMENTLNNYEGYVNVSLMTNLDNQSVLVVSSESELQKEILSEIENVNILIPLNSNLSEINKMVKRYSPEFLVIPKQLQGKEIEEGEIRRGIQDIQLVNEHDGFLKIEDSMLNLEEDSVTLTYIL